jgi:hypothetical protein
MTLVTHFGKLILQSSLLLTIRIRRRVGQTIADVVFPVSEALAMLPPVPTGVLSLLRADTGYPWDGNLNVGLRRGRGLGIGWRLRECACS